MRGFCYTTPMNNVSLFKPFEILLLLAGVGILVSVPMLWAGGSFAIWFAAKALYLVGVLIFLSKA